jgi:hypothetical protein
MTADPPPTQPATGFWGTFPDPRLEGRFRRAYADADAASLRVVLAVAAAGAAVFAVNDLDQPATLPALLALRAAFLVGTAAAFWHLRRPVGVARLDRLAFAWCLLLVALNLAVQVLRPPAYLGHAVITVCLVILTYGVTPLPLRLQAAVAGLHAAGYLAIATAVRPAADPGFVRAAVVGLAAGNALGFLTARVLHSRTRRLFLALDRQAELTATLEKALAEVRTLRGLIRICAWCKGIHADGRWQQLEQYFAADGRAEFTHGICPTCLAAQLRREPASPGSHR